MNEEIYEDHNSARIATDEFYENTSGFSYTDKTVDAWLEIYFPYDLPDKATILDLCCGDGIWSNGFERLLPRATLHGVDISQGGIKKARSLLPKYQENFVVGDAERELPWPHKFFDLIFARGPGLYNQHSMDRPGTIKVIENWHKYLKPKGKMLSTFYSDPEKFGTYTNPLKVALPYNRAPRLTEAIDFTGGKFHSDTQTFLAPFWKAKNVKIVDYRFIRNNHILVTTLDD